MPEDQQNSLQRPECDNCAEPYSCHPCIKCLPRPECKNHSSWSPTYCKYYNKSALTWCDEDPRKERCQVFRRKREYIRQRSYPKNPYANTLDIAFQCVVGAASKHFGIPDPSVLWYKQFFAKVCKVALTSNIPMTCSSTLTSFLRGHLMASASFKIKFSPFVRSALNAEPLLLWSTLC